MHRLHNLSCKMSARLQLHSVSLSDSRWNQKSSKITRDKVCFCVNQEASTHQCALSWHGGLWMRALVTSSRWSWENGGQSLWEEGCDAQWRICPHLSSLLPPNVQSSPSVSGSLMKENTEGDFAITWTRILLNYNKTRKNGKLHMKHFFTGTLMKRNSLLINV